MFDLDLEKIFVVIAVAVLVIGPKDMPRALRAAGRWIGKMRRVSGHFRAGIETMIREAEMEEMERKWREQNEAIMKAQPQAAADEPQALPAPYHVPEAGAEAGHAADAHPHAPADGADHGAPQPQPQLPLP